MFIHGLDGDARGTWSGTDISSFWPQWLLEEIDGVGVWTVAYDAWSSEWRGTAMPMQDRAINLLAQLQNYAIGERPLCFITHSMGGLLVKELLLLASERRTEFTDFADATVGVAFLGTPHNGSALAGVVKALGVVYRGSRAVKDLRRNSAHLRQLNDRYRDWVAETDIRHLVMFETHKTHGTQVVDAGSANPGLAGIRAIGVDANHIDICKPAHRNSLVYLRVKRLLAELLPVHSDADATGPPSESQLREEGDIFSKDDIVPPSIVDVDFTAKIDTWNPRSYWRRHPGRSQPSEEIKSRHSYWKNVDAAKISDMQHHASLLPINSSPTVVGVIPVLATAFQKRDTVNIDMREFDALEIPGHVSTYVLQGGGGTGKTQLAASMAYRKMADVDSPAEIVIWVNAISRSTIQSTFAEAARRLGTLTNTGSDAVRDSDSLLSWLTATSRRWVVVLDDIAEAHDVDGLWPRGVRGNGIVIATTRRTDPALAGGGRRIVNVRTFAAKESVKYLTERLAGAGFQHLLDDSTQDLTEALGHLPLALSHAAAYLIRKQKVTCSQYLERYLQQSTSLSELLPGWADTEAYGRPVTVTLTLGVQAADDLPPLGAASVILRIASLLDPAGYPAQIWDAPQIASIVASETSTDEQYIVTGDIVWESCLILHSYGLLNIDIASGPRAISMHAVAARAVRETIGDRDLSRIAVVTADALSSLWPEHNYADASLVSVLRANADSLADCARDEIWAANRQNLLFRAGDSLFDSGLQATAVQYWQELASSAERYLGPNHPDLFGARARVGRALGHSGNPAAAVEMLSEVATVQGRFHGTEHPATLSTLHDIARWRGHGGDAGGALTAIQDVLAIRRRVLGCEHPDTLASRATYERWRGETGDAAGAAIGLADVLDAMTANLGPSHPLTLKTRNNLAYWRGEAGDAAGAADALEALLADRLRVLGTDNPDTLNTRNNLAYWRGEAGDSLGAVRALTQLVADRTRILGSDHPHTLASRSNLAYWRGKAGEVASAAAEFQKLLLDRIRVLGPDHPDTLDTRANLARWSGEADPSLDTAAKFAALLVDRLRVLGPAHPDTLTTRHEVARWSGHKGDTEAAVQGLAQVIPDRVRVLGADHPDTMATRHELGRWRGESGDPHAAIADLEAVLVDRLRVLGSHHPHTLVTYAEIGRWRAAIGDIEEAIEATQSAIVGRSRILGDTHPDTKAVIRQLEQLRREAQNP